MSNTLHVSFTFDQKSHNSLCGIEKNTRLFLTLKKESMSNFFYTKSKRETNIDHERYLGDKDVFLLLDYMVDVGQSVIKCSVPGKNDQICGLRL
jgi:hypothetical protein